MVAKVIDLINKARARLGLENLVYLDFDNSTVNRDCVGGRAEFDAAYRKMILSGSIDFSRNITMTTTAGVQEYTLPTPLDESTQIDSRNVQIQGGTDVMENISYIPLDEVLLAYPDLSQIPQGKLSRWFISYTTDSVVKKLRFINTPDDTYTLSINFNVRPSTPTGNNNTACGYAGDNYLIDHMYVYYSEVNGIPISLTKEDAWRNFISQDYSIFTNDYFTQPFQHFY